MPGTQYLSVLSRDTPQCFNKLLPKRSRQRNLPLLVPGPVLTKTTSIAPFTLRSPLFASLHKLPVKTGLETIPTGAFLRRDREEARRKVQAKSYLRRDRVK